jgi:hypothetical protein
VNGAGALLRPMSALPSPGLEVGAAAAGGELSAGLSLAA